MTYKKLELKGKGTKKNPYRIENFNQLLDLETMFEKWGEKYTTDDYFWVADRELKTLIEQEEEKESEVFYEVSYALEKGPHSTNTMTF